MKSPIAAFVDAAGSTREAAEKVLAPIDRPVRKEKTSGTWGKASIREEKKKAVSEERKKSGTREKSSQRGAPVFDQAAIDRFATLLGVSPDAARKAIDRLTGASQGRVESESALFAQVAADLGVSVQKLDDATRGLKTWLAERDGNAKPDDKRKADCKKPDPAAHHG